MNYYGSLRGLFGLSLLLSVCGTVFIFNLNGAESETIEKALKTVNSRCPQSYPKVITPLPEPGQLSDKTEDELLAMVVTWSPSLRKAIGGELAKRGDKVIPTLKTMLASENWKERESAAGVISSLVNHNVRNWKEIFPGEKSWRTAQANIRKKYIDMVPLLLPLLKDEERGVRQNGLNAIAALQPQTKEVSEAVLVLFGDTDEYLAQNAMGTLSKKIGLNGADEDKVFAAFEKGIKQPLPGGKGHFIKFIPQQNKEFQKKCVPLLLEHLEWYPTRDTMFGTSGQEQAITLLTQMRIPELIPLLPKLMVKKHRGNNAYYNASVKAIGEYGAAAEKLLPMLKADITKFEKQLAELEKKGVNRKTKKPIEDLKVKIEILKKAVKNVEK